MPANLIVDAHLDLSMNALEWNRDLTKSVFDIRAREAGRTDIVPGPIPSTFQ